MTDLQGPREKTEGMESAANRKILLVDDEKVNLELTSFVFRNRGFSVLTASNASDALALVCSERPDIVLLDYMMPGKDGSDALKEIRRDFPDTPVIILTGRGSEQIAVELMKAGAADYIRKPFLKQDLLERVERVLAVRAVELKNRELLQERDRLLAEIASWNLELERRIREKTEELQLAQAEIIQSEKMSTLGHLAAGMAHEIRNPLNSIALNIQLVKGGLDDDERLECVGRIEAEVRRIDAIVRKLMDSVRRPRFHPMEISIDQVIDAAIETFRPSLEMKGIILRRDYRAIPPAIHVDPEEINQVFSNLIVNSIEEMHSGGVLGVSLDLCGETIVARISDTGGGISPDTLPKIFEPFFTTKNSGTGLGLSVVLRIVRSYDGKIEVESELGKGSTFTVFLPVYSE
jgi:signal transduction histidine kinase